MASKFYLAFIVHFFLQISILLMWNCSPLGYVNEFQKSNNEFDVPKIKLSKTNFGFPRFTRLLSRYFRPPRGKID